MAGLIGERYGKLVVIGLSKVRKSHRYWSCLCDCGEAKVAREDSLTNGRAKSCGCSRLKHGHNQMAKNGSPTRTYTTWNAMMTRCHTPTSKNYQRYGGGGIAVCQEWHDFKVFLADMGERPEGKTLDRKDNTKGYSKDNCRWATVQEQNQNQTTTKLTVESAARILKDTRKQCVIAAEYGVHPSVISDIKRGKRWSNASQLL